MAIIINSLVEALINAYDWLSSIFSSVGIDVALIIVALVAISALYKFVLSPYISGSSDKAVKKK